MARQIRLALRLCAITIGVSLVAWVPTARADDSPPATAAALVPDPAFAACLKREAKVDSLTAGVLASLREVICYDAADTAISDLSGAELMTKLTSFSLKSTALTAIGPLPQLSSLLKLQLEVPSAVDLAPIAQLSGLSSLNLITTPQHDLGFLAGMTFDRVMLTATGERPFKNAGIPVTREGFSITGTTLKNLADFEGWSGQTVILSTPKITDLSPVVSSRLEQLMIAAGSVSDLTPLAQAKELTKLWLIGQPVSDLTPLAGLKSLKQLDLTNSAVGDLSPLAGLPALQVLSVRGSRVTDVAVAATLPSLVDLDVSATKVSSLGRAGSLPKLTILRGYSSSLQNIEALQGATKLATVVLRNCRISDISALADLPDGALLILENNRIHDFSPLAGWRGELLARDQEVTLPDLVAETSYPIALLDERGKPLRTHDGRYKDGALHYTGPSEQVFLSNAPVPATITVTLHQKVRQGKVFTKTPAPTIVGGKKPRVGQTLTVSVPTWTPAATRYDYVWLRNGRVVKSATSNSYTLTSADYDADLQVYVTGHREGHQAKLTHSKPTANVGKGSFTATPVPKITGPRQVGKKLTATVTWSPKPSSLSYQWYRSGTKIKNATKSTYKLTKADTGKRITVKVTGKKRGYSTHTATSAKTAKIAKT